MGWWCCVQVGGWRGLVGEECVWVSGVLGEKDPGNNSAWAYRAALYALLRSTETEHR